MTPDQWALAERLYHEAASIAAVDRASWLARACGSDEIVRREVESLLAQDASRTGVLDGHALEHITSEAERESLVGRELGGYAFLSLIDEGGMGQVYRARDLALPRDVAVKVVSPQFTHDAVRRARFRQEAEVLAGFAHPHIAHVYAFNEAEGRFLLAMELVPGETLAARVARGPLRISEALDIARQVADALDAAHEQGVIHRDLKPANIRITPDGVVKVLDFGLATTGRPAPAAAGITLTHTAPGTLLGTVAYMSPEQARGETVDKRTDIWAFGCVLFEMLTGRKAFAGPTAADTLTAILDNDPDWSLLSPALPQAIVTLLRRCLDKERKRRLRDVGEARIALEAPFASAGTSMPGQPRPGPRKRQRIVIGVMALAIVAAIWAFSRPAPPEEDQFAAEQVPLTRSGNATLPAISPDGRDVAYVQKGGDGDSLWVMQTTTTVNRQRLKLQPGVKIVSVTVSPDGDFVHFVTRENASTTLYRVSFWGDESPRWVLDAVHSAIAWHPDGSRFAFVRWSMTPPVRGTALMVANAEGGDPKVVSVQSMAEHGRFFLTEWHPEGTGTGTGPSWSPDGATVAIPGTGYQKNVRTEYMMFVRVNEEDVRGNVDAVPLTPSGPGGEFIDNARLFWSRPREVEGPAHLWSLSYPSARLDQMTRDLSNYGRIRLTKAPDVLVTTRAETDSEILVGDGEWQREPETVDTSDAKPLVSSLAAQVAWVGDRLLYGGLSRSGIGLWAARPGGAPEERVRSAHSPAPSADGRDLVYLSGPGYSLWRADSDARNAKPVVPDAYWPVTTPAGDVVYAVPSSDVVLWSVARGGSPRQITTVDSRNPDVSRDGKKLAFLSSAPGGDAILWCELPDCPDPRSMKAEGLSSGSSTVRWTADGRGVAYVNARAGSNIWIQPLDGSEARPLTHFNDGKRIVSFTWSPDFARLAIVRERTSTDIVLFKGLKPSTGRN